MGDARETPAPRRLPLGACSAQRRGWPSSTHHHLLWQQPGLRHSLRSASTCCPVTREATLAQRGRGAQRRWCTEGSLGGQPRSSSSAHTSCPPPGQPREAAPAAPVTSVPSSGKDSGYSHRGHPRGHATRWQPQELSASGQADMGPRGSARRTPQCTGTQGWPAGQLEAIAALRNGHRKDRPDLTSSRRKRLQQAGSVAETAATVTLAWPAEGGALHGRARRPAGFT